MNEKDFTEKRTGTLEKISSGCCAFVPGPLPRKMPFSREILRANEQALLALGKLDAIVPALPNPELLTVPFMRREAILSSKIEGTSTELEQLFLFETEEKMGERQGFDPGDAREVMNYVKALEYGLAALDDVPICNRLMRTAHELLLDGVHESRGKHKFPGQFRSAQVYIGSGDIQNARYVPPPEGHIERLMSDLEEYANDKRVELPTLVKIALIHYQFEAIHPFCDGNGRVGRVLILILLAAEKILTQPLLYISAFFERHKDEYVSKLWEISCAGAWREWILFFLQGVIEEATDAVTRAKTLRLLREQYRQALQTRAGAASALALVDDLFHWPVVSIPAVVKKTGMTFKGVQNNVEKLVGLGFLSEVTGNQRNRLYLAKEIVKVIS